MKAKKGKLIGKFDEYSQLIKLKDNYSLFHQIISGEHITHIQFLFESSKNILINSNPQAKTLESGRQ